MQIFLTLVSPVSLKSSNSTSKIFYEAVLKAEKKSLLIPVVLNFEVFLNVTYQIAYRFILINF